MAEHGVTLASNVTEAMGRTAALFLLLLLFCLPTSLRAGDGDEFTFELDEIEKKALQWGGYVELKYEHFAINSGTAMTRLGFPGDPPATIDRFSPAVQLDGSYSTGNAGLNWLLKAGGSQDSFGWIDYADVYEAYGRIKPNQNSTIDLGKKAYKWGKGYAWNPVGFINRPKDPNDPQEALEGYITAELDLIKSFTGNDALGNIALTTVLLPVYDSINDDFGSEDTLNLAAKLYFLYHNTDIDFLFFTGESRSSRFGADFSRNVTPNFEIHAEAAYTFAEKKTILYEDGSSRQQEENVFSGLLGLRYLTANELTAIIEYYHNGNGYTEEERTLFYRQFTDYSDNTLQSDNLNSDDLFQRIRELSLQGYGRPYVGRNYLYAKFSQKEPFAVLYLTTAVTTIVNLDDMSASFVPEITYTGFTNWEIRLRFSLLTGGSDTEYGEKQNKNRAEIRLRYFF